MLIVFYRTLGAQEAETQAVVPVKRIDEAPVRGTGDLSRIAPAPAAPHADRPRRRAKRVGLSVTWIGSKPVPTPFKHIAVHVM